MSNGVKCSIDGLADAIMEGLKEYSDLASSEVKGAVRKAGKLVKDEIAANAPKKTGQLTSKDGQMRTVMQLFVVSAKNVEINTLFHVLLRVVLVLFIREFINLSAILLTS